MGKIGGILLAVWLIIQGLMSVANLHFKYDQIVIGALAIVAGILLLVRR